MSRIRPVNPEDAPQELKETFEELQKRMGKVPNLFLTMGNSKAALRGYIDFSDAIRQTSIPATLREQIALAIGEANSCSYCLAAHTAGAKAARMTDAEILQARRGESEDSRTKAILTFSRNVVEKRGRVSTEEVAALKSAGVNDQELSEIIMIISANMFTNYFAIIVQPELDFPEVPKLS